MIYEIIENKLEDILFWDKNKIKIFFAKILLKLLKVVNN